MSKCSLLIFFSCTFILQLCNAQACAGTFFWGNEIYGR